MNLKIGLIVRIFSGNEALSSVYRGELRRASKPIKVTPKGQIFVLFLRDDRPPSSNSKQKFLADNSQIILTL